MMTSHYEHKHFIDITDEAINEFGSGFCTECGEVVDEDYDEAVIDTSLVKSLQSTAQEISDLENTIQKKISIAVGDLETRLQSLKDRDYEMRQSIKDSMEKSGIKKFNNEHISITYVASTIRKGFDGNKFKQEQPKLYEKYKKFSDVSASVRITIKPLKENKNVN